jgi:hypothetical protein
VLWFLSTLLQIPVPNIRSSKENQFGFSGTETRFWAKGSLSRAGNLQGKTGQIQVNM